MSSRALILLLSFVATAVIVIAVVAHITAPGHRSGCAYGSGARGGCKPRPEPALVEFASAIDGSALEAGMAALRAMPQPPSQVAGAGINRWGETSFTLLTGEIASSGPVTRFVRFDRAGQPLAEIPGAQPADVPGTHPFPLRHVDSRVLREAIGRPDRVARFNSAQLVASFGPAPAIAWRMTYASHGQADPQSAMYAMAANGDGLCRLDSNSTTSGVMTCNFLRLPSTPVDASATPAPHGKAMLAPASPALSAKQDPALKKSFDQMACVKKAQGDVAALRLCVE